MWVIHDHDVKLDYSDVLLVPKNSDLSSRSEVSLEREFFETSVVPIIAANMDGVGTFNMAKELAKHKMMTALIKHYTVDELVEFYRDNEDISKYFIYSMGTGDDEFEKFNSFVNEIDQPLYVCIDVANGYTSSFLRTVERISSKYPWAILMVGNVVTPDRVIQLIDVGASIVKIGIGPGSVCTTRRMTGVGYPQLSAVLECAEAAHRYGCYIVADGGVTCPGDAAKAFAAGADFVMLGGMLAAHKEGLDQWQLDRLEDPEDHVQTLNEVMFYGMASKSAQNKYNGGVADYRASEGKAVHLKYKGPVSATVSELLGGLRSACTYIGAEEIEQMPVRAEFIRVNRQLNNIFS